MQLVINYQDFYNLLSGRTPRVFNHKLIMNFRAHHYKLSKEQWSILAILWEYDGCSQQFLAEKTYRDRPSVSRLIDTMEKEHLVERRADKKDRRTNLIFLTSRGKEMEEPIIKLVQKTIEDALYGFEENEVSLLKSLLVRIFHNLNK